MSTEATVTVAMAARELGLTPLGPLPQPDRALSGAIVSDLLSYVMANGAEGQLWVTLQGHANIVAVAALAGLAAVVVAGGFEPEAETRERAQEERVALFASADNAFTLAGKLYALGLR